MIRGCLEAIPCTPWLCLGWGMPMLPCCRECSCHLRACAFPLWSRVYSCDGRARVEMGLWAGMPLIAARPPAPQR
jgi:hypothetical protein